jgi:hypothetical protein
MEEFLKMFGASKWLSPIKITEFNIREAILGFELTAAESETQLSN